jgi:hypothetical protein
MLCLTSRGRRPISALGNLDGDGLSVNAGRKTQKSGNDSGETHVSDKKRKKDFEKLVAAVRIEGFSEADKSSLQDVRHEQISIRRMRLTLLVGCREQERERGRKMKTTDLVYYYTYPVSITNDCCEGRT